MWKVLGNVLNNLVVDASSVAATTDVNFLLLELFCGGAASGDSAFLAQLLAPTAHTPELLNYMLPWLLLQMLQGIHALPTHDLAPQVGCCSIFLKVWSCGCSTFVQHAVFIWHNPSGATGFLDIMHIILKPLNKNINRTQMQVFAVHMGLISQLEAIGGLEEWALYVAQHLPDGPAPEWRGLRDQLVCPDVRSIAML